MSELHKAVNDFSPVLSIVRTHPEMIRERDEQGDTPAMLAARIGNSSALFQLINFGGVADIKEGNAILGLLRRREGEEHMVRNVETAIRKSFEKFQKREARNLTAAEQTILRAPGATLAPPGSALSKAMDTGILQSQVGKFLTSKPVGESVKPAIRELRKDITGRGKRKRFSTKRKSKRNVATRSRYSRHRS
jgi:hypothetical protein